MADEKVAEGQEVLDEAAGKVRRRLDALLRGEEPVSTGDLAPAGGAPPLTQVGPYRVKRELGAGGMGTVLLAERTDGVIDREVALKLIRGFPTEEGKRRLRQERQVLADLDHPAIARLLDGGETPEGQPYLVMEYVEGEGLLEHVQAAGLDTAGRLRLWHEIAEAVGHAHQRLVVHRDLKPSNVRVRKDGHPKLLDFGVAKLGVLSESESNTSTRVFTPGYAAPEQEAGGAITTRTDVHALGTLLRELLTGLRGDDRPSAPPIAPVPVAADLAAIIAKARSSDPKSRYATVEALQDDLRRFEAGLPVLARPGNVFGQAAKLLWRHRGATAVVAGALATVAAFVFQLRESRDQALEAERSAQGARASAEQEARRSRALLDFVVGTFEAAAPENTLGEKLTVRQLLGAAEGRVAKHSGPDRAALQVLLGQLYQTLGDRANAIRLVGSATVAMGAPQNEGDVRLLVEADVALADALSAARMAKEGIAAGERALALWREHLPNDPALGRRIKRVLGVAYSNNFEHEASTKLLEELLATASGDTPEVLDEKVECLRFLCINAVRSSRIEDALARSNQLAVLVESLPKEHPHHVTTLRVAGDANAAAERWPEAYGAFQEAIQIQTTIADGKGELLASLYNDLGVAAFTGGNFKLAYESIERSMAVVPKEEQQPSDWAAGLANLAFTAEMAGEYGRGLELLEEALRLGQPYFSPDEFYDLSGSRGRFLARLGRFDEGRRVMLGARSKLSKDAGSRWAYMTTRLGQLEAWARRPDAAQEYFDQAEARLAPLPDDAHHHRSIARWRATLAVQKGQGQEAIARFEKLIPEYEQVYGADSTDLWIVRAEQAEALALVGRKDEALKLIEAAIPKLAEVMRPTAYNLVQAEALRRRLRDVGRHQR